MSEELIFKPFKEFDYLKNNFDIAANEYFDLLTSNNKVDVEGNRLHVKAYKAQQAKVDVLRKKLNGTKTGRGFLIALIVLLFIAATILVVLPIAINKVDSLWYLFLIAGASLGLAIYLIVLVKTNLNRKIKAKEEELNKEIKIANQKLQVCYDDLADLNKSFDWGIAGKIMNKVTPLIVIDPVFTNARMHDLIANFDMDKYGDINESVLKVLSGEIQGNPFVLVKSFKRTMGTKTYTGSIVIHWTSTYVDSKGNVRTEHHSQTLTASVSKPCPYYGTITKLHYGNEAAPKLKFSRSPQHGDRLSEKQREKAVTSGMKDIQKKAEEQIKKGKGGFTPMGNDSFDVFFHALDRNNEVEFRLLFTPLAQQNMLSLILNPHPYGDDFTFIKRGKLNTIIASHSQNFDYVISPDKFINYNYDDQKSFFVNYCNEFCQSLYFALAPVLSIPMYQLHKPHSYIYKDEEDTNISYFEQEVMANALGDDYFRPEKAASDEPVMIKYDSSHRVGKGDEVRIVSSSYEKIERVDIISKLGGDGHYHDIPVHWIEYIEVDGENHMAVTSVNADHEDYLSKKDDISRNPIIDKLFHYERGLLSFGIKNRYTEGEDEGINSLFSKEDK